MSFLLLLAGPGSPAQPLGVYLPVHDATVILELSTAPALAADQEWLDASAFLVNKAGALQGAISTKYTRDPETGRFRDPTLTVLLDNTEGAFDRRNDASPFAGALRARRQIRVRAHRGRPGEPVGAIRHLFRGFLRGLPRSYSMVRQFSWVTVSAFSGFRILSETSADEGAFTLDDDLLGLLDVGRLGGDDEPIELSGARIDALADVGGWPADLRSIDPGLVQVGDQDARSPMEAMHEVQDAEAGYLFLTPELELTFWDRLAPWEKARMAESQAYFGGAGLTIFDTNGIGPDVSRTKNDVRRTGLSGIEQSATDEDSIADLGRLTDGPSTVVAVDDDDVEGLVLLRLAQQADDLERLDQLDIEATADPTTLYDELLDRRQLDRITVELREPWSTEPDVRNWIVQSIEQTITHASWRGTYRLEPVLGIDLFTLDDDELGALDGDAVLAP